MGISVKEFFSGLNKDSMSLVDQFYDENCLFKDPVVQLPNRSSIKAYYEKLYSQVDQITFDFSREVRERDRYTGTWTMTLTAKGFHGGKPLTIDGISYIEFGGREGKAIYHRDYFDMGEFVYEWLPIVGPQVRFVKSIFKKNHSA